MYHGTTTGDRLCSQQEELISLVLHRYFSCTTIQQCTHQCCVWYTQPPPTATLGFTNTIRNSKCLCFYKALRQAQCEKAPSQRDKEKELNSSIVPPTHTHGMTLRPLNHLCVRDLRSAKAMLLRRSAAPPVICPSCYAISLAAPRRVATAHYRISRGASFRFLYV